MESKEIKWYSIQTYSGYEILVKTNIEKMIENDPSLKDYIFDVQIPMEETIEERSGKKKVVSRKILPGYVFLKLMYTNDVGYRIRGIRGVSGFVGPNKEPKSLSEAEVLKLGLDNPSADGIELSVGDNVKIVSGALEGFDGKVVECNNAIKKAKVSVTMFGRDTTVEVDYIQLTLIG